MQVAIEQLELSEWLEQYPTLQRVHARIRSYAHTDYVRKLDGIGQQCLAQFEQPVAVETLFGTDLVVGIDLLFESLHSLEAVPHLFNQLPVPATLAAAKADFANVSKCPLDLLTAVRIELAHLMIIGHEQLAAIDPSLADYWLKLYHHTVLTYLRQQADHTSLALSRDQTCLSASFEWAVQHYTTRFDETGALSMYVLGVASFSPHASYSLFDALVEMLPTFSQLLRMAHDVAYDRKEALNTGIFAYASQHNLSLAEATNEIRGSTTLQADISSRLAHCYTYLLEQTQTFTQVAAALYHDKDWLIAFSRDIQDTANALTQQWKPY